MEDFLLYLLGNGLCQIVLVTVVAVAILPLAIRITGCCGWRLLGRLLLFNVLLLGWDGAGNAVWLRFTAHRFMVLDDAPVWFLCLPPAPWMFNHAGGGRDAWELLGHTTFPQLYVLWAATVLPVWLLATGSLLIGLRWTQRQASVA